MTDRLVNQDSESNDDASLQLLDRDFLENLRRQMLKFATLQLSDHHQAEDAVQEALIGALKMQNLLVVMQP